MTTKNDNQIGKNIYQRINAIMKEVSYIQKDSNVMGRYKAVSHDKAIATVRPFLVKEGVCINATRKEISDPFHIVPTDKPIYLFRSIYKVSFINIDCPTDFVSVEVESHSMCLDDKSPGKTYSYAVKMAILKQFCFETGENDESNHTPTPTMSFISKDQANELKKKATKLGKVEKVLGAVGVKDFLEIPVSRYDWLLTNLNKQLSDALLEVSNGKK